ncbi:MAG: LysE family translocator [Thiotrichales bacterium]|nr:LysE family translocator [Thiotrichales bacterium]
MSLWSVLSLAFAMFLLAASPGPGVLLTVSQSLRAGFRSALPVILGIISADLLFVSLALFGLATLAQQADFLFRGLPLFGALYLLWLGWRYWCLLPNGATVSDQQIAAGQRFLSGFMTIFADPKVLLFYFGFLQNFLSLEPLYWLDAFWVILIIGGVLFAVMGFYALLAEQARAWLQAPQQQRWLNRSAAAILWFTAAILISTLI